MSNKNFLFFAAFTSKPWLQFCRLQPGLVGIYPKKKTVTPSHQQVAVMFPVDLYQKQSKTKKVPISGPTCTGPCFDPGNSLAVSSRLVSFLSRMMALYPAHFGPVLLALSLLLSTPPPLTAWDADLELFDLVEEIPQTFYQFMNLDQVGTCTVSMVITWRPRTHSDP